METFAKTIKTDPSRGLTSDEVTLRRKEYGLNVIAEKPPESLIFVFLRQFKTPFIYMLLFAAGIILFLGSPLDASVISIVLIFNATVATIQEARTRNVLASLKKYIQTNALVLRDGEKQIINAEQLVPGDIILLQPGEKVPSDAQVIEANSLQIDESMLTGESTPVVKSTESVPKETEVSEQKNMVFRGTFVLTGTGKAIVTATGNRTQIGKIGQVIRSIETEMPLKIELDKIARVIVIFVLTNIVFLFTIGILQGRTITDLLIMLTALFVCVVPECLPGVFTIILATGAYKMARNNVIVKHLQAAEGLGHIDTLLIDKTGTITLNEMMVVHIALADELLEVTGSGYGPQGEFFRGKTRVDPAQHLRLKELAIAIANLNKSEVEYNAESESYTIKGDTTDAALFVVAQKIDSDLPLLISQYKLLYEIPFSEHELYKASFYQFNNSIKAFITGAPEALLKRSGDKYFTPQLEKLLHEGLRTVAVGVKDIDSAALPKSKDAQDFKKLLEGNISILAILGIQDAIRPDAKTIIKKAQERNIRVIMATGDHKETALHIARAVGIFKDGDESLGGSNLKDLSKEELQARLERTTVFFRVSPQDKLAIINLLQDKGHIVAMTGDGINDAPALVAASIGIAMGKIGTDVAKEAADLVLLDDSLASIIKAIDQSRSMLNALRRVILYFFATNMGELLIILIAVLANLTHLPLLAVQILWLNLVTDGFLDVALAMEPEHTKPEVTTEKHLLDWKMVVKMVYMAIPMAIGSLYVFLLYKDDITFARTAVLICMALFQWMNAWNCRSETLSNFQIGFFSNKWLLVTTAGVLLLQILLLYVPWLQLVFRTVPLTLPAWLLVASISSTLFIIEELRKIIAQRTG